MLLGYNQCHHRQIFSPYEALIFLSVNQEKHPPGLFLWGWHEAGTERAMKAYVERTMKMT